VHVSYPGPDIRDITEKTKEYSKN